MHKIVTNVAYHFIGFAVVLDQRLQEHPLGKRIVGVNAHQVHGESSGRQVHNIPGHVKFGCESIAGLKLEASPILIPVPSPESPGRKTT